MKNKLKYITLLFIFFVLLTILSKIYPVFSQTSSSKQSEIYLKDSMQQLSNSHYKAGLRYVSDGKFLVAKEEFMKALEINPLNTDAKSALKILEQLQKKEIDENYTKVLFANSLLKIEIDTIKEQLDRIIEETSNLKREVISLLKEIREVKAEIEGKVFNLESKIDNLKGDLNFIKNRNQTR